MFNEGGHCYGWCLNHFNGWSWAIYKGKTVLELKLHKFLLTVKCKTVYQKFQLLIMNFQRYFDNNGVYVISEPVRIIGSQQSHDFITVKKSILDDLTEQYSDETIVGTLKTHHKLKDSLLIFIDVYY